VRNESSKAARHAAKAERREQKRMQAEEPAARNDERERLAAAYEREDRHGANQESRRLLAECPPALDDLQSELVGRLRADGIAQVELKRLFSDELWEGLAEDAATFTRQVERQLNDESGSGKKAKVRKGGTGGFIQRRYEKDVELRPDDLWLQIAISPRLLDVVNAYLGLWAKLTYCDQWYTVPMPAGADRTASQNWHRDHVDKRLVKVFVYLSDVDAEAGPFEYVPGSTDDGPYASLWPWAPYGDHYPPREEFEELIPTSAIRTLTGPAGTMILCNTSGFHRGGFATASPRILWRYNYCSPASLVVSERRFTVEPSRFDDSPKAARFALT
jgi:ectoine hydroxylase-related dioxygenase (phytanoyl-CoA dioxygenase family)